MQKLIYILVTLKSFNDDISLSAVIGRLNGKGFGRLHFGERYLKIYVMGNEGYSHYERKNDIIVNGRFFLFNSIKEGTRDKTYQL